MPLEAMKKKYSEAFLPGTILNEVLESQNSGTRTLNFRTHDPGLMTHVFINFLNFLNFCI